MSEVSYHGWTHRPKAQGGTDPIPASSGLPFASAKTGVQAISDNANDFAVVNLNAATFKSNDSRLALVHDVGNSPDYGISIPAGFVAQVMTSLAINSFDADGSHYVSWAIDGGYSVTQFGPASTGITAQSAFSRDGVADDLTRPDSLVHIAHMGDTLDFVVGIVHTWDIWTNSPKDFRYEITVALIGTLPT